MFGAVRPPWIDKEMFYRMPFNFCDRWCERCKLTQLCRVFKDIKRSEKKFIKQGKDPDSWECTFEMVKESFEKTRKLLEKDAARLGIDLNNIDDADYQSPPEPEELPLYQLVNNYSKKLEKFLENLQFVPEGVDEELIVENAEIISYYKTLIPAKTYRAITSKIEEEQDEDDTTYDSQTSAFIVMNGLTAIAQALENLASYKPLKPLRNKMLSLKKSSLDLAEVINLEFNLGEVTHKKN